MNTKKNKKGFTLVELMIVAIIVAILAAVVIPLMAGNRFKAIATEGEAGLGTVVTAAKVYKAENGTWPADIAAMATAGLNQADLQSKHFNSGDYTFTGAANASTYTATVKGHGTGGVAAADILTLTHAGLLTGVGKFANVHN